MTQNKSRALWWKLSEGKLVANKAGMDLDGSTQALVRDLAGLESASKALRKRRVPTRRWCGWRKLLFRLSRFMHG